MTRRAALLGGWLLWAVAAGAEPFAYHTYDSMKSELEALAAAYPELTELFTAQERYGLPAVADGADQLSHYVLRITNESTGLDKPEVLLAGVQHGDEIVSLEVALVLARLLLESYGTDAWLSELVDRREIYFMPLLNPHGFRHGQRESPGGEGLEDMNRDHLYDRCDFACQDDDSLSTTGARAIHELSRRHLFRVVLDYHGGVELIIHPWGTPLHTSDTESPDHRALSLLGQRMTAFGGDFSQFGPRFYPVGTSNDLLGAIHAPLDDTGYATSWDPLNADSLWPTEGWRALTYTVEISFDKTPPVDTLGGDAALLVAGGAEDGYVPKNVRIGLAAIDVAEPYVVWTNRSQIPAQVSVGETVSVEWQVRGCFEVDDTHVRYGASPDPLTSFSAATPAQQQTAGDPCFEPPVTFSAGVVFDQPGTFYLTPAARVDSSLVQQESPVPDLAPRSWVVRSRTEDGFFFENATDPDEVSTVRGRLYWGAEPLAVEVEDAVIFADGFESGDTTAWTGGLRRLRCRPRFTGDDSHRFDVSCF